MAFTRRAAHRIRHVHLKDYVAQFTRRGLSPGALRDWRRRRAVHGDRRDPRRAGPPLAASIEPGALEARHIRLFTPDWWTRLPAPRRERARHDAGPPARAAPCRRRGLPDAVGEGRVGDALVDYELGQVRRSVENVRELGICRG